MSATQFRQAIARQLSRLTSCPESQLAGLLGTPKPTLQHQFGLPIPRLQSQRDSVEWCNELARKFEPNDLIEQASARGPFLQFSVRPTEYIKQTLLQVHREQSAFGCHTRDTPQTVVIDYSSPNIAKPFHAGHLRSTILGNFVKRIHQAMGYDVMGINYLGDWGKQYGLLAVGFEKFGDETLLAKDPIHHLYNVYVKINTELTEDLDHQANVYFKRMEEGDPSALSQWKRFRELSIDSYASVYKRLGIEFERYSGESETEPYIQPLYELLQSKQLITETSDGAWIIDLSAYGLGSPIVRRADGTSLYLTRDLANLILRRSPEKSIYVVGYEQSLYLQQMFKIAELASLATNMHHVAFGRVLGMSTRKGTVVFLQDILDTAQEKMRKSIKENVRKCEELMSLGIQMGDKQLFGQQAVDQVADQLGTSAVIVQDLISKRIKNYTFDYDRMTASRGYTGVYLQYTHARMCAIERKTQTRISTDCDYSLLKEKEAFELALTISQFPDVTRAAYQTMEPHIVVQYLFRLAQVMSQANSSLRIKGADPNLAEARMLLFWSARTTLSNGLKLIGINPLERI
ncbi:arginyl-tRNA synthetase [Fennellomyces sp. T-0311]|nr:arginyl-tRNA synthetase [Fennellomyces sp. T-0311]